MVPMVTGLQLECVGGGGNVEEGLNRVCCITVIHMSLRSIITSSGLETGVLPLNIFDM